MIEVSEKIGEVNKISIDLLQLRHIEGDSVFMRDPEGTLIEFKTTNDGARITFTRDDSGKSIAIEERANGTKLYHISKDHTGLPSSHEIRIDDTELVYFYDGQGKLQHFVELKPNGDRISTVISENGTIYSIDQKQIGGIIFQAWTREKDDPKEGMIWLHPNGDVSTCGNEKVISQIFNKFSRFLDGVRV